MYVEIQSRPGWNDLQLLSKDILLRIYGMRMILLSLFRALPKRTLADAKNHCKEGKKAKQ